MNKKTLMGLPVVETDDLPSGEIAVDDPSVYRALIARLPVSTSIYDVLSTLADAGADIHEVVTTRQPPFDGVRTLGDLRAVLERGAIEEKLAKKLRQVLA